MASYAIDFYRAARAFRQRTGLTALYEQQYGNGSWLWVDDGKQDGAGTYIGVNGYKDAILELVKYEAKLGGIVI